MNYKPEDQAMATAMRMPKNNRLDKQINHFAQATHFFAFFYAVTAQLQYEDA